MLLFLNWNEDVFFFCVQWKRTRVKKGVLNLWQYKVIHKKKVSIKIRATIILIRASAALCSLSSFSVHLTTTLWENRFFVQFKIHFNNNNYVPCAFFFSFLLDLTRDSNQEMFVLILGGSGDNNYIYTWITEVYWKKSGSIIIGHRVDFFILILSRSW